MLSLLKNKIRNKFLQTDYIHPYIIWCIDVFLSVIFLFSIFLFFHYLINISIHFNQQRYILLIAVISSIVWTGICKTYEGIIRYSTYCLLPIICLIQHSLFPYFQLCVQASSIQTHVRAVVLLVCPLRLMLYFGDH